MKVHLCIHTVGACGSGSGIQWDHVSKGYNYSIEPIPVAGIAVPPADRDQPIKYLGLQFYVNRAPTVESAKASRLLQLIGSAKLKPFQKVHCWRQLVQPAYLYGASNSLQVHAEAGRLDKIISKTVKAALHLPQGFPNSHIWMPSRCGGLGLLQLQRVALVTHYKALTRLVRLGDSFVDELFREILGASHFAVTWDANEGILVQMCAAKRAKYACLKSLYPGKAVSVLGMAFGARSMLCRETLKAGECLGLTKQDVGWLAVRTLLGSIIVLSRFGRLVN
ncbi:hypothetical protein HPB50_013740 [Hyalomma asiaticum]|uniref:Uncharacterized protein n=1 Tax=Hyalomma asiaticum TaxID=266040 RepID=A0ACB7SH05_HYAAI|nr:hypothetical protein HPB50_013740 [Hyalomma asiaticum]